MTMFIPLARCATAMLALVLALAPATAQQTFPTPEAAAKALVEAAAARESGFVTRILGPDAVALVASGDPEEDQRRLDQFNAAAAQSMTLTAPDPAIRVLTIGRNGFAFPVPIVRKQDAWVFDIAAGRHEILNRTIGFNEASAIEACKAYVAAQKEYFRLDRDGDAVQEYAQRIVSTPGRHDGLYWPPSDQADRSPLDERIAPSVLNAALAGRREPYRGYYFRILKAQGPAAPGGAYRYVINGRMIAGFALVAWPAEYRRTGVMTFICGPQGRVYQADLGPRTARRAAGMTRYDPGPSWALVAE